MRVSTFSLLVALLAVVDARPILSSHFVRDDTTLDAGSETAVSSLTDVSTATPTDSSLPTATADASGTDSIANASASVTDSAIFPSESATDSVASATDASPLASATDSSFPASTTDSSFPASATDTPASATDPSATISDSSATASAASVVLPTELPVSPPACAAIAANLPPPPADTSTADPSTPTASTDSSTGTSTASSSVDTTLPDSGLNATSTAPLSSDSTFATATASATDSALPATATNATIIDPFATGNNTQDVSKRIAQQDLPAVAQAWQDLCLASGGDIFTNEPCVQLAGVGGINALLANSDPCAQQDNADAMIDFAKSPGVTNADALIQGAVTFRKHPRNALNILGVIPSTPFCQNAPRNKELVGVVNDQLPGVDPGIFGGPSFGLIAFGDDGTCPFGSTPDVDSCNCVQSTS